MANGSAAQLQEVLDGAHKLPNETDTNNDRKIVPLVPKEDGPRGSDGLAADHFKIREGVVFAGTHLLVEMWEAQNLTDPEQIGTALADAARAAGATVLHSYMHPFGPEMGVSGVVVLAESHISIHTWPERGYAALDIFMCGACDPHDAVATLETAFCPGRIELDERRRGMIA